MVTADFDRTITAAAILLFVHTAVSWVNQSLQKNRKSCQRQGTLQGACGLPNSVWLENMYLVPGKYYYETDELPNLRPAQPKKIKFCVGFGIKQWFIFWIRGDETRTLKVAFRPYSKWFFEGWDWFYKGNKADYKTPNPTKFSANLSHGRTHSWRFSTFYKNTILIRVGWPVGETATAVLKERLIRLQLCGYATTKLLIVHFGPKIYFQNRFFVFSLFRVFWLQKV